MSIFETLFGKAPAAPQPPATQPGQTNQPPSGSTNPGQPMPGTAATSATAPNGVVPAGGAGATGEESPLAQFAEIWKTVPQTDNQSVAGMFAGLDPNKIMESASKVDFTKAVTPELLAKIQAGGPEATGALLQVLNKVQQTGYAQSAIATTKIVEQALERAQQVQDSRLPSLVKQFSANESIAASNPLFTNPALQPLVQGLQQQFLAKNPQASVAEIQTQVEDYFKAIGMSFAPPTPQTPAQRGAQKEYDWSKFLG